MSGIIAQNTLDNTGLIKSPAGGGAWNFIKKLTASGAATLSFVDGASDVVLDSTYKLYLFTFKNIHLSTDAEPDFLVNFSSDGGSNYNATKTSTSWYARHAENNDFASMLYYIYGTDLAQSTANQYIGHNQEGSESRGSLSGSMYLWNPASTVFAKYYMIDVSHVQDYPASWQWFYSGYCNTTSAIDAVRFYGE